MEAKATSGRHLYGRGWFGLIPLVGGFVGLGLIFLGLFKYKDRKLTIIGFAALLFTLCIYGAMIFNFKYGENTAKAYSKISQRQLNSLPKQIELYKMQYGQYPDSLKQLYKIDRSLIITDPLLTRKLDRSITILYRYKTIEEGYTLFSVGIDGIPNTSDDLYPTISVNDKMNYGLLKR